MDLANKLREKGIRVTPQRRVVYSILNELCHSSVDDIVGVVVTRYPYITVATVYNVLDCFAQNGLISRLSTPKGKLYYDINTSIHHHIITDEAAVVDYNDNELTLMITNHLKKHPLVGYDIEKISLQIFAKQEVLK